MRDYKYCRNFVVFRLHASSTTVFSWFSYAKYGISLNRHYSDSPFSCFIVDRSVTFLPKLCNGCVLWVCVLYDVKF